MNKDEYVKEQKENIKNAIKSERKLNNTVTFLTLSGAAVFALMPYFLGEPNNYTIPEDRITPLLFTAAYLSIGVGSRIYQNRAIKKLRSKKIELPTDEEINEHNLKAYHLEEAAKLKSKIL